MSDPWLIEGAMLASCYVVGVGMMAATAIAGKKKNRRKKRNGGSSLDSRSSGAGTLASTASTTGGGTLDGDGEPDDADDLPLCPNDADCNELNDPLHYQVFSHTCRLNPCYHAHVEMHCVYFRHTEGQCIALHARRAAELQNGARIVPPLTAPFVPVPAGVVASPTLSAMSGDSSPVDVSSLGGSCSANSRGSPRGGDLRPRRASGGPRNAAASRDASTSGSGIIPSQQLISPNVPNAVQLAVRSECDTATPPASFYIWGDWRKVRVHALKRYLHQVTGVPPAALALYAERASTGGATDVANVATAAATAVTLDEMDDMNWVAQHLRPSREGAALPTVVVRRVALPKGVVSEFAA